VGPTPRYRGVAGVAPALAACDGRRAIGLPLPIGMLAGAVAAALFVLVIPLPALRLRADYLAIVTVAVGEIFRLVVRNPRLESAEIGGPYLEFDGGMFEKVDDINDSGTAVLMVEQNAKEASRRCDRGYVLVDGQNRYEDSGTALLDDEQIRRDSLGGRRRHLVLRSCWPPASRRTSSNQLTARIHAGSIGSDDLRTTFSHPCSIRQRTFAGGGSAFVDTVDSSRWNPQFVSDTSRGFDEAVARSPLARARPKRAGGKGTVSRDERAAVTRPRRTDDATAPSRLDPPRSRRGHDQLHWPLSTSSAHTLVRTITPVRRRASPVRKTPRASRTG